MQAIYDELQITDKCTFSEGSNKKLPMNTLSQYWSYRIIWHLSSSAGVRLKELYCAFILVPTFILRSFIIKHLIDCSKLRRSGTLNVRIKLFQMKVLYLYK